VSNTGLPTDGWSAAASIYNDIDANSVISTKK